MVYQREMRARLELERKLVGSFGGNEEDGLAAIQGSEGRCISQEGLEEAFGELDIEKGQEA